MVREIRVPSSSSSASRAKRQKLQKHKCLTVQHTDSNGLDPYTLLDMGILGIVGILAEQNLLAAQRVHEGGTPWSSNEHRTREQLIEDFEWSSSVPVPEAPQTIRQNWIPFFICFLRRI
jgi:hypothetical protein